MDEVGRLMLEAEDLRRCMVERFSRRWPGLRDDAESQTCEATWRAALRFDPAVGQFRVYSEAWIRGALQVVLKLALPAGYRRRVRVAKSLLPVHVPLEDFFEKLCCQGRLPACLEDDRPDAWDTAMSLLTPVQAHCVGLYYGEGLTATEIAAARGVSEQSVSNSLKQALCRLKQNLGDRHEEEAA